MLVPSREPHGFWGCADNDAGRREVGKGGRAEPRRESTKVGRSDPGTEKYQPPLWEDLRGSVLMPFPHLSKPIRYE